MSTARDLSRPGWRKSSYSNGEGGNCLELARGSAGTVAVRDSKNPTGPVLLLPAASWMPFVDSLRGDGG